MPPEIDRNDPNYAFTGAGRAERMADIDRSLGYSPDPAYRAYDMPPPAASPAAQPGQPAYPGMSPYAAGQPYPGWQPSAQPAAQPDPAQMERDRLARENAEMRAREATMMGVFRTVQQELAQREEAEFYARREQLDPETALHETDRRWQQRYQQALTAQQQTAAESRAALMALHADNFTNELFQTMQLTPDQQQHIRDMQVDPYNPEPGANARASVAAAYHEMNERLRQLGLGQGVAIYTAAGVNRVGGLSPSGPGAGAPQPGQAGYHRDPVVRAIAASPYYGVR